jgi:hypothetical protein
MQWVLAPRVSSAAKYRQIGSRKTPLPRGIQVRCQSLWLNISKRDGSRGAGSDETGRAGRPQSAPRPSKRTRISSSPIRRPGRRSTAPLCCGPSGGRSRPLACVGSASRSAPHVRHQDGRRGRADADAPGVDGTSRPDHDGDLCRLRAGRPRGGPRQRRLRVYQFVYQSETNSDQLGSTRPSESGRHQLRQPPLNVFESQPPYFIQRVAVRPRPARASQEAACRHRGAWPPRRAPRPRRSSPGQTHAWRR